MKVVFIFKTKFTKRDYHRFGLDVIKNRGHNVEIWEVSSILIKKYSDSYKPKDEFNFKELYLIKNNYDLKIKINGLDEECIVIDPFNCISILDYVAENKFLLGGTVLGLKPFLGRTFLERINDALYTLLNPEKLAQYVRLKFYGKFRNQNIYYDCIIKGGGYYADYDNRYKTCQSTVYIDSHALDYDRYLDQENNKYSSLENYSNYAVFIDEAVCNHPDYIILGNQPDCTPNNYYPDLNNFFDDYEKSTNHEVIIAKHPRNSTSENNFNGRRIISNETIELVKNSILVFLHSSTSINFPVLYKKPALIIDSKKYSGLFRRFIKAISTELSLPLVDISSNYSINYNFKISEQKYSEYKQKYIKKNGTPEKNSWEIFCDYLDGIN